MRLDFSIHSAVTHVTGGSGGRESCRCAAATVVFFPSPPGALETLAASAFVYKSKIPLLPINPEFEQTSCDYLFIY